MDKDNQLETKPLEQTRLRHVKQCLTCLVKSQQMLIILNKKNPHNLQFGNKYSWLKAYKLRLNNCP